MNHTNSKIILCLLFLLSFYDSAYSQNLDVSGTWTTVNVDNCCTGQHTELAGGQKQDFTIPTTVPQNAVYFALRGGDGGHAKAGSNCKSEGGDGASVNVTFFVGNNANQLKPGGKIRFIVGKHGKDEDRGPSAFADGGGGGGTAILYQPTQNDDWIILAVAGGGGGAYQGNALGSCVDSQNGQGGRASESGGGGAGSNAGSGGSNGTGGGGGDPGQEKGTGGGGGAYSDGGVGSGNWGDGGALGYPNGGSGGLVNELATDPTSNGSGGWGFGGGGAAAGAGGGGGGYSGGGGGGKVDNGGAGGSYVNNNYAYLKEINEGSVTSGTEHGHVGYQFFNLCAPEIESIEQITGFCNGTSQFVDIQVHTNAPAGCFDVLYHLTGNIHNQINDTGFFTVNLTGYYSITIIKTVGGISNVVDEEVISVVAADELPPLAKCQDITVGITGEIEINTDLDEEIGAESSDNCGIASMVASQHVFTCSQIGTSQTVTLTVTDQSGNTASCTSRVTLRDTGGPIADISSLPTVTGECSVTVTTIPTATDHCSGAITATTNDPLTYTELGTHTLTWNYQDNSGNVSTQTQTVIVTDLTAPTVTCPDDITVEAPHNSCIAIVNYAASSTDNCAVNGVPVNFTGGHSGNTITVPAGNDRILLFQASHFDDIESVSFNGNPMALAVKQYANIVGTCEVWYVVLGSGPAITGSIISTGGGGRYTTFENVNQNDPISFIAQGRHKGELLVSARPNDMIYEGFMRRDGNQINPLSGQTEVYDLPFNSHASRQWAGYKAASGGLETVRLSTSNGAHVAIVLQANHFTTHAFSIEPNTSFSAGVTPVTFTATDLSSNVGSCSFNVTVLETTAPTISCPDDITVDAPYSDQDICTVPVTYSTTTNDNCGSTTLSNLTGMASGADFPVGTTVNTLQVSDGAGLTATCSFSVTVRDVIAPQALCQNKTVFLDATGNVSVTASQINNNSFDVCGSIATMALDITSFTCDDQGTNTVTLTVTDDSGNSSTCQAAVSVQDLVPPTALCQDQTIQLDANGDGSINAIAIDNGSSDACDEEVNLSLNSSNFNCDDIGANTITLTATDDRENTSTCSATITVLDQVIPTAICQDRTIQLDANGTASISSGIVDDGSSDACGLASQSLDITNFDCTDVGSNTVILTIFDTNNNSSTCQATITILDNVAPAALCQDITVQLDENGDALVNPENIDNGSTDHCGIQSLTVDISNLTCNVGSALVTLTVMDSNGNSSNCTANVTVVDQIAPTASCNDITINLVDRNTYQLSSNEVEAIALSSADNCVNRSSAITNGTTSYDCDDINASFEVTLTVTDASNLTSTCLATVTVADPNSVCNDPPVALCQDITVMVDSNCEASITASQIDHGSSDPDLDELIYGLDNDGPFGPGDYEVTLTVDDGEYTSTCLATVTVADDIKPIAVCKHPTITLNGENSLGLSMNQIWDEDASGDNCGEVFYVDQSVTEITCDQLDSTIPVTVTVEDAFGNTGFCTANVDVTGLPCGWTVEPNGIGCNPGEGNYDPSSEIFTLSTEGCYDPSYYRVNDAQGFIQTELCGDGEIIAQVTSVIGAGWAGITMRESNDPTARMIQLMCDGVALSRREFRNSSGSPAFAHMYQTAGRNWLRLTRIGNHFSAYQSMDGNDWEMVFTGFIPMDNCINVGLMTMNGAPSGAVTGHFENVFLTGIAALSALPNNVDVETNWEQPQDFTVYPNPASNQVNVDLVLFRNEAVQLKLYNHFGQVVLQNSFKSVQNDIESFDLSQLTPGTYILELKTDKTQISKKLVKADIYGF